MPMYWLNLAYRKEPTFVYAGQSLFHIFVVDGCKYKLVKNSKLTFLQDSLASRQELHIEIRDNLRILLPTA